MPAHTSPVSAAKLKRLLKTVRVSQHHDTIKDFVASGEIALEVHPTKADGKLTGLQSGLQNARRRMIEAGELSKGDVRISLSNAENGVFLINEKALEAAGQDAAEDAEAETVAA